MNTIRLAIFTDTDDPAEQAAVLDAFNRCAVGLALQGVTVMTTAGPLEDE